MRMLLALAPAALLAGCMVGPDYSRPAALPDPAVTLRGQSRGEMNGPTSAAASSNILTVTASRRGGRWRDPCQNVRGRDG
jgi:hypothetical protein